jgi:long-subunit acyl-CoA synthetase (AMP-forming)
MLCSVGAAEEVYWEGDSVWIEAASLEENVYGPIAEIDMVVLVSDRNRSGVVAVVVPQQDFVRSWEQEQAQPRKPGSTALLQRKHPRGSAAAAKSVPEALAKEVLALLVRAGAGRVEWEIPIAVVIELTRWSEQSSLGGEESLLTLTAKPKRGAIKQAYLEACSTAFGEVGATGGRVAVAALKAAESEHGIAVMEARQSAGTMLEALRAEAADECHSRQQHEYVSSQRKAGLDEKLPAHKKGSRLVDTAEYSVGLEKGLESQADSYFISTMLDALASTTPVLPEDADPPAQALTARSRDWLAPTATADRFCFRRVRDVDELGELVPADRGSRPVDGPTDITVGVVIDLPVQRLEYLRGMGITYEVHKVAACLAEPLSRLRRRIGCLEKCAQCPPRSIRIFFGETMMEDDRIPLIQLGIRDGSELTVSLEPDEDPYYPLPQSDAQVLNLALSKVAEVGLNIRSCEPAWIAEYRAARRAAQLALGDSIEQMKVDATSMFSSYCSSWGRECAARRCPSWPCDGSALRRTMTATNTIIGNAGESSDGEAPFTTAMRAMISTLISGHRRILEATEKLGSVSFPIARQQAFADLTVAIENLRTVGDALDVETRALPVTWTLDLDWVCRPTVRATTQCFMPGCGRQVFVDQMSEHTRDYQGPCCELGLVPDDYDDGRQGTTMGGSLAIICDVSGAEIDPEDTQQWPAATGDELPFRSPRVHSIESGIDRAPLYHEIIEYLTHSAKHAQAEAVPGATEALALIQAYDVHGQDTWVKDKQNIYWLHEYVKEGKQLGLNDTPASMAQRAFDAFAERPSIAVPTAALVPDQDLPRNTSRTSLPDAAKATLSEVDGFLWLKYSDLGRIVTKVAEGLVRRLPLGSLVAIAGYNDFEWIVADMAIACAGMCAVGLHTTYETQTAVDCMNKLEVSGLVVLSNLVTQKDRGELWSAAALCANCSSLKLVVASDQTVENLLVQLSPELSTERLADFALGSMLDWSAGLDNALVVDLPEPFSARGASYGTGDGNDGNDMFTVLFTSGSSGAPKAVAIGTDAFVSDISGDQAEAKSLSASLTVSYIPLSHSSDRYKCWQHLVLGGRVAFCYFSTEHWTAHEQDKKDSMIEYASPVAQLFAQIQLLRPTSMACPPNVWMGLHEAALSATSIGGGHSARHRQHETRQELLPAAAQWAATQFGGRMKNLATGGAPTPPELLEFAQRVARAIPGGATLVNSYGATECGAIAVDGRQNGSKFDEVRVGLIDRPDIGFSHRDDPHPRGEVVVASPSVALGYIGNPAAEAAAFIVVDSARGLSCPREIRPVLPDGRWYRTGDIASRDPTGLLTLIDRASAIVSTKEHQICRTGELEATLERLPNVMHALVHVSPDWVGAVAIISVHDEDMPGPLGLGEIADHPGHARNAAAVLPTKDLPHGLFWQVAATNLRWTAANGMLSGELKKKRGSLLSAYWVALEELHRRCDRMILHGLPFDDFEESEDGSDDDEDVRAR